MIKRDVLIYVNSFGKSYFEDWLHKLKDIKARAIIRARIERIRLGNFGDCKSIGDGIYELRIVFASGYRIYFGQNNYKLIILLCGGNKATQNKDIIVAKKLWKEYKNGNKKLPE